MIASSLRVKVGNYFETRAIVNSTLNKSVQIWTKKLSQCREKLFKSHTEPSDDS